jgi:hypothetical protein
VGSVELDISAYHERNLFIIAAAIFASPLPNHSHDLFFIADFHDRFSDKSFIITIVIANFNKTEIIMTTIFVNVSEIIHKDVLINFETVDLNFDDFLVL